MPTVHESGVIDKISTWYQYVINHDPSPHASSMLSTCHRCAINTISIRYRCGNDVPPMCYECATKLFPTRALTVSPNLFTIWEAQPFRTICKLFHVSIKIYFAISSTVCKCRRRPGFSSHHVQRRILNAHHTSIEIAIGMLSI